MSADIEQLLREAMQEAAQQAVGDGRPVPPLREPDHATAWRPRRPDRGQWFLPLAATAAVLALLAGGAIAVAVVSGNRAEVPATGVTTAPATTSESAPRTAQPELVLDVGLAPQSPVAGTEVTFTVRGTGTTAETDGHIDHPIISFGDGTPDAVPASIDPACSGAPGPIDNTFTEPHTYTEPGSYQVTVTIGSCGLSRTQTLTVEVAAGTAAPELVLDVGVAPQSPLAGTEVTFTVRGTGSAAETDGHIDHPIISFGDGTPDAVPASIDPACSGAPGPIDDTFTEPHIYTEPGSYQVTVTIGSCGLTRTETLTVDVRAN